MERLASRRWRSLLGARARHDRQRILFRRVRHNLRYRKAVRVTDALGIAVRDEDSLGNEHRFRNADEVAVAVGDVVQYDKQDAVVNVVHVERLVAVAVADTVGHSFAVSHAHNVEFRYRYAHPFGLTDAVNLRDGFAPTDAVEFNDCGRIPEQYAGAHALDEQYAGAHALDEHYSVADADIVRDTHRHNEWHAALHAVLVVVVWVVPVAVPVTDAVLLWYADGYRVSVTVPVADTVPLRYADGHHVSVAVAVVDAFLHKYAVAYDHPLWHPVEFKNCHSDEFTQQVTNGLAEWDFVGHRIGNSDVY